MGTQVIDFNNVENVVFNSNQVETLKLNNNIIWEGFKKLEQLIDRSILTITAEDLGEITIIRSGAFANCRGLTYIEIPSTVQNISSSFNYCDNVITMKLLPIVPPTLFAGGLGFTSPPLRIEVPAESLEDYKSATYWSDYANIMVGV